MQQTKIYVGNLSYDTTSDDLSKLFAQYGEIAELKLITDRETGRSKGFAFLTFANQQSAQEALALNGTEFQGRRLKINIAREEGERRREGGGGGGYHHRDRGDRNR